MVLPQLNGSIKAYPGIADNIFRKLSENYLVYMAK
jgi:hypothetical protein